MLNKNYFLFTIIWFVYTVLYEHVIDPEVWYMEHFYVLEFSDLND